MLGRVSRRGGVCAWFRSGLSCGVRGTVFQGRVCGALRGAFFVTPGLCVVRITVFTCPHAAGHLWYTPGAHGYTLGPR
ncbi:MAG: hypothetical protein DESF_00834 [Desulfovibrio sp.]